MTEEIPREPCCYCEICSTITLQTGHVITVTSADIRHDFRYKGLPTQAGLIRRVSAVGSQILPLMPVNVVRMVESTTGRTWPTLLPVGDCACVARDTWLLVMLRRRKCFIVQLALWKILGMTSQDKDVKRDITKWEVRVSQLLNPTSTFKRFLSTQAWTSCWFSHYTCLLTNIPARVYRV